jgi:LAO/AO transport system kinase
MKAGLMEIGDVFVINKADRDGADKLADEIRVSLHMRDRQEWEPPVLLTKARDNDGIDAVIDALQQHYDWLVKSKQLQVHNHQALLSRVRDLVDDEIRTKLWADASIEAHLQDGLQQIQAGQTTPYRLAGLLLRTYRQRLTDASMVANRFPE